MSRNKEPIDCPLLDRVKELLSSCGKSVNQVAVESGLPYYWVQSVRFNKGIDPAVSRTIKLYEYLTGKKLEVH